MKKFLALSVIGILASVSANAKVVELHTSNCDIDAMRAELNSAVASHHAVITKIVCDEPVPEPAPEATCGEVYEEVVAREYFVRETVQMYRPVVHYIPGETYTTMRAVCDGVECQL